MTTTELAAQLAADPRFRDPKSALFDETAARHGRDFAGIAFIQACLKADQDADAVTYLPGGCHEHADGEIVTNSECHQPEAEAPSGAEGMRRTCDDCGAEPGTECAWSCSSRWT